MNTFPLPIKYDALS